ncbi:MULTISPECIES: hypothetical protein [unclassified Mesorhizobium]
MSAAMPWITEPSQSLFQWQIGDVIQGGPFRQTDNVVNVPEDPGIVLQLRLSMPFVVTNGGRSLMSSSP